MASEILNPQWLVIPKVAESVRDTMYAEPGTLIYNTDTDKLNFSISGTIASADAWEAITSAPT